MKRFFLAFVFVCAIVASTLALMAQPPRPADRTSNASMPRVDSGAGLYAPLDVLAIYPLEVKPGEYRQVDPQQLQIAANNGWQLVSVTPYVYRNEPHLSGTETPGPLVTQVYSAYFFQRARLR